MKNNLSTSIARALSLGGIVLCALWRIKIDINENATGLMVHNSIFSGGKEGAMRALLILLGLSIFLLSILPKSKNQHAVLLVIASCLLVFQEVAVAFLGSGIFMMVVYDLYIRSPKSN